MCPDAGPNRKAFFLQKLSQVNPAEQHGNDRSTDHHLPLI